MASTSAMTFRDMRKNDVNSCETRLYSEASENERDPKKEVIPSLSGRVANVIFERFD